MATLLDRYNTNRSEWIEYIECSKESWDGYVIVVVMYMKKKQVVQNWFWATEEDYMELKGASSIGSVYYHWWSVMRAHAVDWYSGQDKQLIDENGDDIDGLETGDKQKVEGISNKDLNEAIRAFDKGELEEWSSNNPDIAEKASKIIDKMESIGDLFDRASQMRKMLSVGDLTTNKMMKMFFNDISEFFGVNFNKKFVHSVMSTIVPGELNPTNFVKYKMRMKSVYTLLDKEGLTGLGKIGRNIASAQNPLIRSRNAYKGKEVVKGLLGSKNWLKGEDATKAIRQFHRKTIREQAQGFKAKNGYKLEQRIVDGKRLVRWKKDLSFSKKFFNFSKKVLRIAKFFV